MLPRQTTLKSLGGRRDGLSLIKCQQMKKTEVAGDQAEKGRSRSWIHTLREEKNTDNLLEKEQKGNTGPSRQEGGGGACKKIKKEPFYP